MKVAFVVRAAVLTAVTLTAVAACGSDNGASGGSGNGGSGTTSNVACAKGTLSGQGSTFQQNMEKQWTSAFGAKCSGAQISYTGTGSGAGIQQFGSGTVDFAGTDVPMKTDEQAKANQRCSGTAIHIPVTAGGVAIVYNLKGVNSLNLSAGTLAGIFQGSIKTWNDPKIAADNPGVSLPGTAITAYHRADGSGTTSVFADFEKATAPSVWTLGTGKSLNWKSGQAAKGSDGVVAGVKQTQGGVTYAEVSFAKQNELPTAKVKGASGDFTELTGSTVSQAIATGFAQSGSGNDVKGKLDFTKIQGYPISTVSYVIACQKYADTAKGTLVKDFVSYAVTDGQSFADKLGFAPLPSSVATAAKEAGQSIS